MAAPMAVAAALGFFGSKASTFVLSPAAPTSAPLTHTAAGYQPSIVQPAAGTSTGAALCAGAALGFAGAAASATTSVKSSRGRTATAAYDPTSALGVLEPTGYWDPCGLMKERVGKDSWQWKDEATFDNYRTAELKHGRVAMMAAVGMITTTVWKFPGFQEVPDGLAALDTTIGGSGFGIVFILAAYFEITNPKGDFDVPGPWGATDEMKAKELANGRLAMAAVITLLVSEYGLGETPAQQFAETAGNLMGSGGFATGWALLILGFAWTQGWDEINWSWKNAFYTKGLLAKPEPLALPSYSTSTKALKE